MRLSNLIPFNNLPAKELRYLRVWKGIFGIRDFTKIRCGIREKAKCIGMKRDLTATREAGFTKILARDEGFFCLSGIREVVLAANANQTGEGSMVSLMEANYRDILVMII